MTIQSDSGDLRILVVDDHDISSGHAVSALQRCTGVVRLAITAAEALRKALSWHPHVICMDFHLPDLDGIEVIRKIRRDWPTNQPPPRIILLTGDDPASDPRELNALGIDRLLVKPVTGSRLREAVMLPASSEVNEPCRQEQRRELLGLFRTELEQRIPELDRCLLVTSRKEVARIVHQLIASAAITGEVRLEKSLRALSAHCRSNASADVLAASYYAFLEAAHAFLFRKEPRER